MVDFWFYLRNLGWFDAVRTAEARGDTGLLVALLRAKEVPLTQGIRNLLADLLERRTLRPKKGGQRTPLFEMSAEQVYKNASDHVDDVMKSRDMSMIAKYIAKGRKKIPIEEITQAEVIEDIIADVIKSLPATISDGELKTYLEKGETKQYIAKQYEIRRRRFSISEDDAIKYVVAQWNNGRNPKPKIQISVHKLKNFRLDKIGFGRKAKIAKKPA
jgi:hypothetical protein